jgi:hypothetical protein
MEETGVITDGDADKFGCIVKQRFCNRETSRKVPAKPYIVYIAFKLVS